MKNKLLKGLFVIVLGYLLLVALHFVYLELGGSPGRRARAMQEARFGSAALAMPTLQAKSVSNYATMQYKAAQSQGAVEQKYEKIGSIDSTTEQFSQDEDKARTIIKEQHALIQGEAVNSYNDQQRLNLTIGVPPENFDAIVSALKAVGKLSSFNVTKTDKTNDYLELKAKKATLLKARDSLIGLKAHGGKIEELVKLEQEILKLEGQIQDLGVQLGQFDKVNEFCTVRFSLAEKQPVVTRTPHLGYLVDSLRWASTVYLALLGVAVVGLACVILLLIAVEKSKIFSNPN